jgi:serine/threonine protein kinase
MLMSISNTLLGGTLWNYVLNNSISLKQSIKFGKDIAAGMCHIHSEGFLHCDLAAR